MKYILTLLLLFSFSCGDGLKPDISPEKIEKKIIEAVKNDTAVIIPGPPAEPPAAMYNDNWKLQDVNPNSKDHDKVFNLNKFAGQKIVMVFHSAP
jgi:hypothetical protein